MESGVLGDIILAMDRKFQFSVGEFYHLYNRGSNKMPVFLDSSDKKRFIKLLFVCNSHKPVVLKTIQGQSLDKIDRGETLVDVGAYCLMPNHFHLLIKEKVENGISEFMKKISTGYSMYFNKRYERTGGLFEGTFKATHANDDEYLKYLFAYIHLNSVKLIEPDWKENGIKDKNAANVFLKGYEFSSHVDYLGVERTESLVLNRRVFPEYFSTLKDFNDMINDWLSFKAG